MANDILVKIGADISDFSRKMAESSKALKDFGNANSEIFDAFKKTGAAVTGAGVALAGGLGIAVKTASNFESAMSSVAAISGATGEDFELLSAKARSEEHTSELQSRPHLVCRLLLEKKKQKKQTQKL